MKIHINVNVIKIIMEIIVKIKYVKIIVLITENV